MTMLKVSKKEADFFKAVFLMLTFFKKKSRYGKREPVNDLF